MMHPSCNSLVRCSLPLASLALALLASQSAQAATCPELLGREIPAQAIGLPTSGARVTAATPVAGGGSAPQTFGAYCDVSAEIRPVDPATPAIRMRLVLPEQWNRKAMMFGGGGYNGTVPNVAGNVPAGPLDQPTPLGRGYAVFGSDSGHVADPASPGSFAWNDEALANYAHDALKKTRDTAVYLIEQRYGATPERSYFAGGSTGGREALAVVQQWPTDFHGAIVLYPAYNALALDLQFGRITRALAQPGAFPSLEKRAALLEAAMQACDGLDGVRDGVISHQAACNAQFDPARAKLNGKPLRCPGGADTSQRCLSDAQIHALRVFNSPIRFNFPLASGETHYPGFNTWGTDLGRPGEGVQLVVNRLGLNTLQPSYPMPVHGTGFAEGAPYHSGFWDEWVRFFVTRNPTFNSLTLDPQNPRPVAGAHQRAVAAPGRQPDRPVRIRPQRRQDPHGPRYLRPTGEHPRHRRVLRACAPRHGPGQDAALPALLRDPRLRPRRQHRVQRRLGFAERTGRLGRTGPCAAAAGRCRQRRRARPHPPAVRIPRLAEVRRQGRRQCRHKLRLRAEPQGHPLASEPAPAPRPAPSSNRPPRWTAPRQSWPRAIHVQPAGRFPCRYRAKAMRRASALARAIQPNSPATSATGTPFALCPVAARERPKTTTRGNTMRLHHKSLCHILCGGAVVIATHPASAAFVEDSKASIDLRNFYMNRDFRSGTGQSKAEEWAQGFMLKMESGYTEGPIGFGVDAIGLLGVKLDSSTDRVGTGILQSDRDAPNRAQDDYGSAGVTAKAKLSATTLHVGTLQPILPVVMRNDSRLLPQTYRGAWLQSKEIDGLTLDLGKLDRVNQRNSSDNEEMTAFNGGRRNIQFGSQTSSDEFLFAGARYAWSPELSTSYFYGGLDGIYKEHNFGLVHVLPLGDKQSFKTDLRYVHQTDDGGSNVDADAFGAMFTYKLGGHAFGAGYQQLNGDTGFAYIAGSDNSLVNLVQINDFGNEDERSWQVRYDYDFAAMGIPGLSLMTRYLSGDNVDRGPGASEGKTWERNTDLAYVFQSSPLKNLGLRLRNATTRSNFGSDLDENRFIVSYSLPLW